MEQESQINKELIASQENNSGVFFAVVKNSDKKELFESKFTRKTANLAGDAYEYLEAETWMSLGTWVHVNGGLEIEGIKEDVVVLGSQVTRCLTDPERKHFFYAILLHEYEHKNSGHRGALHTLNDYDKIEIEANEWAMQKIVDSYLDQPWAEKAFDYVALDRDSHIKPRTETGRQEGSK